MREYLQVVGEEKWLSILVTIWIILILQVLVRTMTGRVIGRLVKDRKHTSASEARKREETLTGIIHTVSGIVLWAIGIAVILSQLEVNLAAIATGAGLIGVVVGIGAQSAIKDYLAGFAIIMENQFRIGDVVTLASAGGPVSGTVEDITIRITRLRDLDGVLHTVPNGSIDVVSNKTFQFANINLDISIDYDSDVALAEKTINKVGEDMSEDEVWGSKIIEPIVFLRVEAFTDVAVILKILGKVKPGSQWDVAGEYRRRLKLAFDKAGIVIPYPHVVMQSPEKTKAK